MKKIGLIAGLGPEATVDYYKEIINGFRNNGNHLTYPEIIIYSVNMSAFLELMNRQEFDKAADFLMERIGSLQQAGAEFAAITANTPHLLFDRIRERSPLPLISIVEATCRRTQALGYKRPGLLGTGFTMNASFYQEVFSRDGIQVFVPENKDKDYINHKLFTEIELGIFKEETRRSLEDIIARMADHQKIDAIILGCTELPLILTKSFYNSIPVLNTTKIHAEEIMAYCLKD